jgi:hypothetical protein
MRRSEQLRCPVLSFLAFIKFQAVSHHENKTLTYDCFPINTPCGVRPLGCLHIEI